MLKGLVTDAIIHLRECILINASMVVSFAAGAAYLKMKGKDADVRVRIFFVFSAISSFLVLFPVTNAVLRIIAGTYYDAPDIWTLVPLMPFGAVMCSVLAGEMAGLPGENDASGKMKKKAAGRVALGMILITSRRHF